MGVLGLDCDRHLYRSRVESCPFPALSWSTQVSMANEMLKAHETYYMDDRTTVLSVSALWISRRIIDFLQCGRRLFRIPYWHLKKYSPVLLRLVEPDTDRTRGTSDDTAIPIDGCISAEEFVMFLDFFYRGFVLTHHVQWFRSAYFFPLSILRKAIPTEEWCKLLVISSKLECEEVRTRAIDRLTANISKVCPVDRIELGNKYNVPQWLPEAYADAFVRESHLTIEEAEKLGLEIAVKVLRGRDRCKRMGWNSTGNSQVIRLVEDIFPPLKPERRKTVYVFAGKPGFHESRLG